MIRDAGLVDVELADRADWYRQRVREEYEQIHSELYPRMVELPGQQEADHFVENWRSMTVVCTKGSSARDITVRENLVTRLTLYRIGWSD